MRRRLQNLVHLQNIQENIKFLGCRVKEHKWVTALHVRGCFGTRISWYPYKNDLVPIENTKTCVKSARIKVGEVERPHSGENKEEKHAEYPKLL